MKNNNNKFIFVSNGLFLSGLLLLSSSVAFADPSVNKNVSNEMSLQIDGTEWATLDNAGTVSATAFVGDGSGLTGVTATVGIDDLTDAMTNAASNTIILGHEGPTITSGNNNLAIGSGSINALTEASDNVAIGLNALNRIETGGANTAIGYGAMGTGNADEWNSTAVGKNALANGGSNSVAVGHSALFAGSSRSIGIGEDALNQATGARNIGIGYRAGDNITTGTDNIMIGDDVDALSATGNDQLNIGDLIVGDLSADANTKTVTGSGALAVGTSTTASGDYSFAGGNGTTASGNNSIAFGSNSTTASGGGAISIGTGNYATNTYSVGIGRFANATASGAVALGQSVAASGNNSLAVNGDTEAKAQNSFAFGFSTVADGSMSVAGGQYAQALGLVSFAYGEGVIATGDNSVVFGIGDSADISGTSVGANTFAIVGGEVAINQASANAELDVSGTISATAFVGDGSGLTGVTASVGINDLTDAIHDTDDYSSLFLGNGAGANDDGTDNRNVGVGENALSANTSGTHNVAIGISNLSNNSTANNNVSVGYYNLVNSNADENTAVGHYTLSSNTSGTKNTAVGGYALNANTTSESSSAFGFNALLNSTGHRNTAMGRNALLAKVGGNDNVGIGYNAGSNLTSGASNIFIGEDTTAVNTTGSDQLNIGNTIYGDLSTDQISIGLTTPNAELDVSGTVSATAFVGDGSGLTGVGGGGATDIDGLSDAIHDTDDYSSIFLGNGSGASDNGTDNNNVGLGKNTLTNVTSGDYNTAIGALALSTLVTGQSNVAVGESVLFDATGNQNTGVGVDAIQYIGSGNDNVAIGFFAGRGSSTASNVNNNVFIGNEAGEAILTGGDDNVFIGYQAGTTVTAGARNIIIGSGTDTTAIGSDDELNIGNTIYGDLSNDYIGIGMDSPSEALDISGSIEYTGTLTDLSDRRLKQNIKVLAKGQLEKINQVNPVSFEMKNNPSVTEFGVIAQELEEVYPTLVKTANDEMGTKSVNYVGLIGPMMKAIQELNAKVEAQQKIIEELKDK